MGRFAERDAKIVELKAAGLSLSEVAERFGLTRARISQIVNRPPPQPRKQRQKSNVLPKGAWMHPKFSLRQKVVATEAAYEAGLFPNDPRPVTGIVSGWAKSEGNFVRVRPDCRITASNYSADFWEPVDG